MNYSITKYDGICNTPALALLVRAQAEMLADGTAPLEVIIGWDDLALVAWSGTLPVGVISYKHEKWRRVVWAQVSYTLPDHRRAGVHSALWARLVYEALQLPDVTQIQSGVHIYNFAMLAALAKAGRQRISVVTSFPLLREDSK